MSARVGRGLYPGLRTETRALIGAMTVYPSGDRIRLINTMISRLIRAGLWAKIDHMWVLAAHDAQAARLSWITPGTMTATEVNSPTFTADRGYAGNGTTSYIDSGWGPDTGVKYLQDDAAASFWCNTEGQQNIGFIGSGSSFSFFSRSTTNLMRCNMNSATVYDASNSAAIGFASCIRTSSTAVESFKNGASLGAGTKTSTTRLSAAMSIGANFVLSQFSTKQAALAMVGASRTVTEEAQLYDIIREYMRGVGNST